MQKNLWVLFLSQEHVVSTDDSTNLPLLVWTEVSKQ